MELEWLGKYREFVGTIYRSANAYSMIAKRDLTQFPFTPYEVQIMEYILENENEYKNMTWYAQKLGLSTSTYSKYVKKLVSKGLLDRYHASDNRKNIILKVSDKGREEYQKYSEYAKDHWFRELFAKLDQLSPEQLELVKQVIEIWGGWHTSLIEAENQIELTKIEEA